MTTVQRDPTKYSLRSCEPQAAQPMVYRRGRSMPPVLIRPGSSKRRMRTTIVESGAYEQPSYRPTGPLVDREKEKDRLARRMAGNEAPKVSGKRPPHKSRKDEQMPATEEEMKRFRFAELMKEIKDREQWFEDMQVLGEGTKHQGMIEEQIRQRLREIDALNLID